MTTIQVCIRLPPDLHQRLVGQAEQEQRSLSNLVRLLLLEGLERRRGQQPAPMVGQEEVSRE